MRWLRLYEDACTHHKLCNLSDHDFRVWVELLCLASKNDGLIPPLDLLKKVLRRRSDHLKSTLNVLIKASLIDECDSGFIPHNWLKRQYKSDFSKERTKRWRDGHVTAAVTPPDTDTDTDKKKKYRSSIPENWSLSETDILYAQERGWANDRITSEGERFKNHHIAKGSVFASIHRAWCNWVTSPYQQQKGNLGGTDRESGKSQFKAALRKLQAYAESNDDAGCEVIQLLPAAGRGE